MPVSDNFGYCCVSLDLPKPLGHLKCGRWQHAEHEYHEVTKTVYRTLRGQRLKTKLLITWWDEEPVVPRERKVLDAH